MAMKYDTLGILFLLTLLTACESTPLAVPLTSAKFTFDGRATFKKFPGADELEKLANPHFFPTQPTLLATYQEFEFEAVLSGVGKITPKDKNCVTSIDSNQKTSFTCLYLMHPQIILNGTYSATLDFSEYWEPTTEVLEFSSLKIRAVLEPNQKHDPEYPDHDKDNCYRYAVSKLAYDCEIYCHVEKYYLCPQWQCSVPVTETKIYQRCAYGYESKIISESNVPLKARGEMHYDLDLEFADVTHTWL